VIRLEHTGFGPRLFLLGRRVHEYQLGVLLLAVLAVGDALGRIEPTTLRLVPLLTGIWLVAKDWRDVFPRFRDTSTWTLGIHRKSTPLRPFRATDSIPRVAALATGALGLVNLASALTPNMAIRGHLLSQLEPVSTMRLMHALAVPASLTLLTVSYYLDRRRRSAWRLAIALLAGLVVLDVAKGLDVEEALLSLAGIWLLWWGRGEFAAGPDRFQARTAVRRAGALALGAATASVLVVRVAAPHATWTDVVREVVATATWQSGPIQFTDELGRVPVALGIVAATSILASLCVLLRPLARPALRPGTAVVGAVERIVHRHGDDTLDFFKLRRDLQHVFDPSRRAVVSYRIESGVMLCAGDPVGPRDACEAAVTEAVLLARRHGLRLGAIGVSERSSQLFAQAGLRRIYLGDEAVVETAAFSLEGRAVRKVRQSVTRLEKAGFSFGLVRQSELTPADRDDLEAVSAAWLDGDAERGFTMSLDTLLAPHLDDTLIAIARDSDDRIRGFLHFVPARGAKSFSLSTMRRDPDTPNGLTEFLVARSIEALRARGGEEVSLNFAVLARYMQAPRTPLERLVGRVARLGNPHFQIESLFRFNAKFSPRWEPRYLVFESWPSLLHTALAAAWAEGQLPRPMRSGATAPAAAAAATSV
jgi:lysyl-tRNA synthetase class 2